MSEPVNVADFEEIARERLDPGPYAYFAGGAGDERTLRAHVEAFARWELRPRVLVGKDLVRRGKLLKCAREQRPEFTDVLPVPHIRVVAPRAIEISAPHGRGVHIGSDAEKLVEGDVAPFRL